MNAEAFASNTDEPKLPSRFTHHFDTHGMWGCLAFIAVSTILSATGNLDDFSLAFWAITAIQVPYFLVLFKAVRRHRVLLCPHCVAAFPLNPGEHAAGRARFALATVHMVFGGLHVFTSFLDRVLRSRVLGLIAFALITFPIVGGLGFLLGTWFTFILVTALILMGYAMQRHKQLELWCPWCRRDDGGDDDDPPQPEPDPAPGVDAKTDQLSKTG